jgi:hypothetical protein
MYGGFWKNIISVHLHRDLPLGLSDMFFQQLNTHRYSPVTAGTMSEDCFWRGRVRTDQRWDEGVGTGGGGQLGSSARARRSLGAASPAKPSSLPWGRGPKIRRTEACRSRRSGTVWRRRSGGSPAAGKTRYGGFSVKYSRNHHLLRIADPGHYPFPSPSRYPVIDRLPQAVCPGLLQRHTARIGGPLTT